MADSHCYLPPGVRPCIHLRQPRRAWQGQSPIPVCCRFLNMQQNCADGTRMAKTENKDLLPWTISAHSKGLCNAEYLDVVLLSLTNYFADCSWATRRRWASQEVCSVTKCKWSYKYVKALAWRYLNTPCVCYRLPHYHWTLCARPYTASGVSPTTIKYSPSNAHFDRPPMLWRMAVT